MNQSHPPKVINMLRKVADWEKVDGCAPTGNPGHWVFEYAAVHGLIKTGKCRIGPLGVYTGETAINLTDAGRAVISE